MADWLTVDVFGVLQLLCCLAFVSYNPPASQTFTFHHLAEDDMLCLVSIQTPQVAGIFDLHDAVNYVYPDRLISGTFQNDAIKTGKFQRGRDRFDFSSWTSEQASIQLQQPAHFLGSMRRNPRDEGVFLFTPVNCGIFFAIN